MIKEQAGVSLRHQLGDTYMYVKPYRWLDTATNRDTPSSLLSYLHTKMGRKKRQARLTFEPVADSESPDRTFAPANVRYSKGAGASGSPGQGSSLKQTVRTPASAKKTQSKLQTSSGMILTPPFFFHCVSEVSWQLEKMKYVCCISSAMGD